MRRVSVVASIWLLGCLLAACLALHAQRATGIKGKVSDTSGSAVANAAVSLTDLTTNRVLHTTTDPDGQFSFDNVTADPQIISIEKSGFESFSEHVTPSKQSASTSIQATLQVATLAESVVVRGQLIPRPSQSLLATTSC